MQTCCSNPLGTTTTAKAAHRPEKPGNEVLFQLAISFNGTPTCNKEKKESEKGENPKVSCLPADL